MEEKACLLCHSSTKDHVPLDITKILKIRVTLPDLNLKLFLDQAVICKSCSLSLENYSKAISDWSRIEHGIIASGGRNSDINLEEICLKKYYQEENIFKICRLCLIPISSFVTLTEEKATMWKKCLSVLNLKLTMDPVLCSRCDEILTEFHQFTVMCTTKEETLMSYIQEHPSENDFNFLTVVKRINGNWSLSDLRIENIISMSETEKYSRYNTRKRKIVIENDADDEDVFDGDDEDRDPDFTLGGSDSDTPSGSHKPGNRKKISNRVNHTRVYHTPRKERREVCKYCNEESTLCMQLHHLLCEKTPFKREGSLWICVYCSLEDTDWNRLEMHLKNCDNYQTTLQRKQLASQSLLESSSLSEGDENLHPEPDTSQVSHQNNADRRLKVSLHTPLADGGEEHLKLTIRWNNTSYNSVQIQGSETLPTSCDANSIIPTINLSTSRHDSSSRVETLSINNNNSASNKTINILSNVLIPLAIEPKKPVKKFTESSQCLIVMKCVNCKFNTRYADKLLQHILGHMDVTCPDCSQKIEEKTAMYKHLTEVHRRDFTRWYYWCVSCVQLFRARRSVEAHKCSSTRTKVVFKSNGTTFCMLCKFESDDLKESLNHQMECLKDMDKKGVNFVPEVIEID